MTERYVKNSIGRYTDMKRYYSLMKAVSILFMIAGAVISFPAKTFFDINGLIGMILTFIGLIFYTLLDSSDWRDLK